MTVVIEPGTTTPDKPTILWDNLLETGTLTVSSQAADGAGANALEDTTFDFWLPTALPATLTVDLGTARECDALGIAAHTAGSVGATIDVQSSTDGTNWTTRGSVAPLTDDTVFILFPPVSARYWRIRMTGALCAIGVAKLGKRLVIPTGVLSGHVAIHHAREIELTSNESIKGHFIGTTIIKQGAQTEVNFGLLDADFVENDMAGFERHYDEGCAFFYAGSPSTMPKDMGYCKRQGRAATLQPSYAEGATLMQVAMQVSVYVE